MEFIEKNYVKLITKNCEFSDKTMDSLSFSRYKIYKKMVSHDICKIPIYNEKFGKKLTIDK